MRSRSLPVGTPVMFTVEHGLRRLHANRMGEKVAGHYVGKIGVVDCAHSQPDGRVYYAVDTGPGLSQHPWRRNKRVFAYHTEVMPLR